MKRSPLVDRLSALADPIRARALLLLERHELTVTELRSVLQLPQSTVSRHLKVLAESGWLVAREDGTSNRYRLDLKALDASARKLWAAVREDAEDLPSAARDAQRVKGVLAERHTRSQQFFASSAAQWDKMRAELFGTRSELFALVGLLDADAVVGDLGCGAGQLTEVIAPFVRRVIAVDESPAMLKAARARLAALKNVELRSGSIEELPVDDAALDVAVLSLVLHYVTEPVAVLTGIRRALKPKGGRLLLVDMLPHDRAEYRQTMGHVWLGFDAEQVQQWGREAGFASVRVHPIPSATAAKGPSLFSAVLQA
ncbi:MAG: metalloregulator ArsR/SmtB family transcription factor [Gemmatimonadaceae bacterium]|nr:metalloregulator ArsR/SmtB family transcription factor [Gemmatimonadaceae bacterium]